MRLLVSILSVVLSVMSIQGQTSTYVIREVTSDHSLPGGGCKIIVELPSNASTTVMGHITRYVKAQLTEFGCDRYPDAIPTISSGSSFSQMLDAYSHSIAESYSTAHNNMFVTPTEELKQNEEAMRIMRDWTVVIEFRLKADTDDYISFLASMLEDVGGFNSTTWQVPTSIRKSDGLPIENIFKREREDHMQFTLRKLYMSQHPNTNIFNGDDNDQKLRFPVEEPWLAPDGLHLIYNPGELFGLPHDCSELVIPISEALPCISKESKILLINNAQHDNQTDNQHP